MPRTIAAVLAVFMSCGPDDLNPVEACDSSIGFMAAAPAPVTVTSHFGAPGGFRIAIVSEGYTEAGLKGFEAEIENELDALRSERGSIVGRRPELFTFYVVSVASATARVKNADRTDTAFGACLAHDNLGLSSDWFVSADREAARQLARDAVGSVDVVVLHVNTAIGRASAELLQEQHPNQPPVIVTNRVAWRTLDHELGHALIGLADEYAETADPMPLSTRPMTTEADGFALYPNVTSDPTGAKWALRVTGAAAGGMRWGGGVFHPAAPCRMNALEAEFCPVCDEAILHVLDARQKKVDTDGLPRCSVYALPGPGESRFVMAEGFDLTPPVSLTLGFNDGLELSASATVGAARTGTLLTRQGRTVIATATCRDGRGLKNRTRLTLNW